MEKYRPSQHNNKWFFILLNPPILCHLSRFSKSIEIALLSLILSSIYSLVLFGKDEIPHTVYREKSADERAGPSVWRGKSLEKLKVKNDRVELDSLLLFVGCLFLFTFSVNSMLSALSFSEQCFITGFLEAQETERESGTNSSTS